MRAGIDIILRRDGRILRIELKACGSPRGHWGPLGPSRIRLPPWGGVGGLATERELRWGAAGAEQESRLTGFELGESRLFFPPG